MAQQPTNKSSDPSPKLLFEDNAQQLLGSTVTRPTSIKSYKVSKLDPINEEVEPFPAFEDPAKTLIIQRLNLIDDFCSNRTVLGSDSKSLRIASLTSRIADSGHIKHGQDGSRGRVTIQEAIEYGKTHRARLNSGNKRWLASWRGLYKSPYINRKEPEPKDVLQRDMIRRFSENRDMAQLYANEFGLDFINKHWIRSELELGEAQPHTTMQTYPAPYKVFVLLSMFRNTFPAQYAAGLAKERQEHDIAERKRAAQRLETSAARTPASSPATPDPPPAEDKRISVHSNNSDVSFASFTSADTFGAGVRNTKVKVTSAVRKATSKIPGLRRLGGKVKTRETHAEQKHVDDSTVSLQSFNETEQDAEALQEKLDSISRWIDKIDFVPVTEQSEAEVVLVELPADVPVQPAPSPSSPVVSRTSKDACSNTRVIPSVEPTIGMSTITSSHPTERELAIRKPASKEFVIDVGIVSAPLSEIEQLYEAVAASVSQEWLVVEVGHVVGTALRRVCKNIERHGFAACPHCDRVVQWDG